MSATTVGGGADVAIVGAGPAGCAAAVELARAGCRVLLLERSAFPRHKVCGEFLSPEVAGILEELGVGAVLAGAAPIESGRVVTPSRCSLEFSFPAPAYGLSRYALDAALARRAADAGATLVERTEIASLEHDTRGSFLTSRDGRRFAARVVLFACGRDSLFHPPGGAGGRFFGVKAHYRGAWPARLDLLFFPGGYLGVAPIEDGRINVCAWMEKRLLKEAGAIFEDMLGPGIQREGRFFFTGPLRPGWQSEDGDRWVAGDAAIFLDPFTGDGIALALQSGRLAAQHLLAGLKGSRLQPEATAYVQNLQRLCGRQLAVGRLLRLGLKLPVLEMPLARLLASKPSLRHALFRATRSVL